jgi:hypothetical protein
MNHQENLDKHKVILGNTTRDIMYGIYQKLLESPTQQLYFVDPPYLSGGGDQLTQVRGAKIEDYKVVFIFDNGFNDYEVPENGVSLHEVLDIYEDFINRETVNKFTLSPFYQETTKDEENTEVSTT